MTHTPLDDHAVMYLRAARSRHHRPCIGLVRTFEETIPRETLAAWARQLAANPAGFGRRVEAPRLPGARPRWVPSAELPPIRYLADPLDAEQLAELVDEETSSQPDPSGEGGWRLAAARTAAGETVVTLWLNHAYGDARSILSTAFEVPAPTVEPTLEPGAPVPLAAPSRAARRNDAVRELGDVVRRLRTGFEGSYRLGRDAATTWWAGPEGATDLPMLRPVLDAWGQRAVCVGTRSGRRTVALARVPADQWEAVARSRGGSANTLLLAVLANLLRGSRIARGEPEERPVRVLMPVDLRRRSGQSDDTTANTVTGALVVVRGGEPDHNDLAEVRNAARQAITVVSKEARRATRAAPIRPAGIVDAMRLLPDALTYRMAVLAQGADGVASNIGLIPHQASMLGSHRASQTYLLGSPMMTDTTICCGRSGDELTFGVVADVARQGPGGAVSARVTSELAAWGLEASVR